MIQTVSTERVFSLSSFEGLKLIRNYAGKQPDLGICELIRLIERIEPDGVSLDLVAAGYLDTLVEKSCPTDGPPFYQACIKAVLVRHQPIWAKSMRQGRKRFVSSLDRNDQDVFAAAGLMEDPPSTEVVFWWDDIAGHARLQIDIQKMEQARAAERLSISHEIDRLSSIGIGRSPIWTGLEDNFAGYDVLSFDHGNSGVVNIMIEVKSTISSPLRFIVSRNEWEQAEKVGDAYFFHVWDMDKKPPELFILTVGQVAPHIPSDSGKGKWTGASIPLAVQ